MTAHDNPGVTDSGVTRVGSGHSRDDAWTGDFRQLWLPLWPLASDDLLEGVYRQSRTSALGRRYIEANPQAMSNLLVVDIDHPDAALRALSAQGSHPMPNAIVSNRANGHAHAVWALAEPVIRTEYARRKPLAYAAAVNEALRRAVDGDKGYSGLITKNPVHEHWDTEWLHAELRSLPHLADELGARMPPANWRSQKARRANPVGLGRNCSLFDSARVWAYQEARRIRLRNEYPTSEDADLLLARLVEVAHEINTEFGEPLPVAEVRACVASIHRWITVGVNGRQFDGWRDSRTVNSATFVAIQSARGRRSGRARRAGSPIQGGLQ
ncbi:replication initiation protein [Gordonia westfalica]|uniref:Replication initiation protein n=1 Tax=Gordonia westfalica TaxID=158898 RepID=A0ABU2GPA4_9ACTN|nr:MULTISPECIES: replication initiation protein [Gordonia]MDS1112725.1 replication initiation protein [Gordonia westfalica]UPW14998.1 replication initiation protein [Gordonia amicalis]